VNRDCPSIGGGRLEKTVRRSRSRCSSRTTSWPRSEFGGRSDSPNAELAWISSAKCRCAHFYQWLRAGFLIGEQITPAHTRASASTRAAELDPIHRARRWLAVDEAATALGVARQTVLHKV
jgi:hypothetical protein